MVPFALIAWTLIGIMLSSAARIRNPKQTCSPRQLKETSLGEFRATTNVGNANDQIQFAHVSLIRSAKDWDSIDIEDLHDASDMYVTNTAWNDAMELVSSTGPGICRNTVNLRGMSSWDTYYAFEQVSEGRRQLLAFVVGEFENDRYEIDAICARSGYGRSLLEHVACHMETGSMHLEALGYVVPFYHKIGFQLTESCAEEPNELKRLLAETSSRNAVASMPELEQLFAKASSSVHPLVQLLQKITQGSTLCGEVMLHSNATDECSSLNVPLEFCQAFFCSREGVQMTRCLLAR
eukprot:TRINITY_DN4045_c0_g4_i1.p1 TRINITY_DN4045_c0_g4~~TRINITY_DN4045_c0_g4_i1.p1  ORF type:complete len:317 (-),score=20.91 TRINITY_DN4045_c0_g4_i1:268-1149(-)